MMKKESVLAAAFPDADPASSSAFYSSEGDLYQALMFSDLFWPTCFTVRGAVFLEVGATTPEWVNSGIDRRAARTVSQRMPWNEFVDSFNWFEVSYLFGRVRGPEEAFDDALDLLVDVLQQSWSARLRQLFPDREFELRVNDGGPEALNISVQQIRPALVEPE